MMRRIIFVGLHNKPGMTPLDSKTKSGKLIDLVIAQAIKNHNFECLKSNLWTDESDYCSNYLYTVRSIVAWSSRVEYQKSDIIIGLGAKINSAFQKNRLHTNLPTCFLGITHPSRIFSKVSQELYINNVLTELNKWN